MLIRIPRCDALGQNPRVLRVAQVASIAVSFGGPEGSVIEIGWLFQSLSFGPGDALHRPYNSAHNAPLQLGACNAPPRHSYTAVATGMVAQLVVGAASTGFANTVALALSHVVHAVVIKPSR